MIQAKRILVPVNGDPTDDEAISFACEVARRTKAQVYAIYVIEVKRTLALDVDLPQEAARGDKVLAHAERLSGAASVELSTEILQARDVGTAIVDEALEREVDLIVMGVAYKRPLGDFDLGKTAPYVLKHAPCRVLLSRAEPRSTAAVPDPAHDRQVVGVHTGEEAVHVAGHGRGAGHGR